MVALLPLALAHGICDHDKTEHKWAETYSATAAAFAEIATRSTLFQGEDGAKKTAALFVAWSYNESRFDPKAIGDKGTSFGLFQIKRSTAPTASLEELTDSFHSTRIARDLMLQSFRICKDFPLEERGGWYAAGGEGCKEAGRKKSRVRIGLAIRLDKEAP